MTEYEKLKNIIAEAEELLQTEITSSDEQFIIWKNKAERFISNKFGMNSFDYKKFEKISFFELDITSFNFGIESVDQVSACKKGLFEAKEMLKNILEDLEDDKASTTKEASKKGLKENISKIFIVHGHDGQLQQEVARVVEKQGIEAVILSDKANQGKTIIEKIEKYSDVGCAVCLFTADDLGKEKNDENNSSRARQNVVFEAGYFIGKLGRERVTILADDGIEMPSDLGGVVYTSRTNWQFELCKELKAMGFNIDANKLL